MPRPTRSRVASARAAAAAAPTVAVDPAPVESSSAAGTDIYDVSDREKEKLQHKRATRASASTRSVSNPQQTAAISAARERRDSAMHRLENLTSTTGNTNTADEDDEEGDGSSIEVEVGRRATAATPMQRGHSRLASLSGLDLDDDMFDDLNTTINTVGSASAQRSNDTSTLSATHFKRRPRAGSFMSRDDGPIRPSSRAGPNTPGLSSTFNIGVFKRRAREPSILGTVQKERPQRPLLESDSGDKSDDEAETEEPVEADEFAPEAESTPLRRSKRRSEVAQAETVGHQPSITINPRKRKSTENQEQRARSSPYAANEAEQSESEAGSPQPSLPSIPRELSRPSTPLMDDEDMAPPMSSGSSEAEADIWPPLQSLAKGRGKRPVSALRRTPVRDDNVSDMSSPPSLTHSPNYDDQSPPPQRAAKHTRKAAAKSETKVTTAALTGLLPRRRQRNPRNDPFALGDSDDEVDTSGLGNEDDELTHLDVRTRSRTARPLSRAGAANQTVTRGRSAQRKGKQTPGSPKQTRRRTYGRSSDKENQDDEDIEAQDEEDDTFAPVNDEEPTETSEQMEARMGEELKNAAKKFKEVDKWELEYEEMTQSSSPRDAR